MILQPDKQLTDAEKIHDEVHQQVSKCTCVKQFRIHKIGEGKYRVSIYILVGLIFCGFSSNFDWTNFPLGLEKK